MTKEFYPADEQGIKKEKTSEEKELEMQVGEREEDVYSEEGRHQLEEDDEIEPWEEGFMQGASGTGQLAKDALTGEPLLDIEDVVEANIGGQTYRFATAENAEKFRRKKEEEDL